MTKHIVAYVLVFIVALYVGKKFGDKLPGMGGG